MAKKIVGATLGHCVHVAGVLNFLRLAEACGYQTTFLGVGCSDQELIGALREENPEYLAVSYRLTPEVARKLFASLKNSLQEAGLLHKKLLFGGTPPVAAEARKSGLFTGVFSGEEEEAEIVAFLKGQTAGELGAKKREPGKTLLERIQEKAPYPLLRHHFGLPGLEETIAGVGRLAEAGILDVISLGPDQNAQESFFRPEEMDPAQDGAGGVPIRREEDLIALYRASRRGNFPLLRCYSGTRDLILWGELTARTIKNAWGAVPLFWYNRLDGRSDRPLREAIAENQQAMAWYAAQGIPVEVNEAHHWSLRGAPDSVAVAAFYLAAYNAKKAGVRDYVAQLMLNNPPGTSGAMDLGKCLAKIALIERLAGPDFRIHRQIRAGLASLAVKPAVAKGQLAASTLLGLALKPEIIHVVAFCEADHAATPDEIIESCGIVQGVLKNSFFDAPDLAADPAVQARRDELIDEAELLIETIQAMARSESDDPLTDPVVLQEAVRIGLLDAPQLKGNPEAAGRVRTGIINGACRALSADGRRILGEEERLQQAISRRLHGQVQEN
ncbi:MAG: cobalamin B12-binding domain-containing protein [Firmicutes bacterium]|nr:cobalamin B12-binding domain-containing protein [Bacillota bacterium]